MSSLTLNIVLGVLTALISLWPMRVLWKATAWDEQIAITINCRQQQADVWASLTDADREWFHANYWDGEKVLDERHTE